jgi:hypothetical protein
MQSMLSDVLIAICSIVRAWLASMSTVSTHEYLQFLRNIPLGWNYDGSIRIPKCCALERKRNVQVGRATLFGQFYNGIYISVGSECV